MPSNAASWNPGGSNDGDSGEFDRRGYGRDRSLSGRFESLILNSRRSWKDVRLRVEQENAWKTVDQEN